MHGNKRRFNRYKPKPELFNEFLVALLKESGDVTAKGLRGKHRQIQVAIHHLPWHNAQQPPKNNANFTIPSRGASSVATL